ncbi:uncharacterized protein LOC119586048 [Penaeus monodon]|uniref:uncharacterized protein LOC119586048 n=1 Tax=Penaeus monodon TaxID=6687 RepID=UPI0018A7DA2F|nr:uncharacterized protein LOC119586048 [Penaeus monodon]
MHHLHNCKLSAHHPQLHHLHNPALSAHYTQMHHLHNCKLSAHHPQLHHLHNPGLFVLFPNAPSAQPSAICTVLSCTICTTQHYLHTIPSTILYFLHIIPNCTICTPLPTTPPAQPSHSTICTPLLIAQPATSPTCTAPSASRTFYNTCTS